MFGHDNQNGQANDQTQNTDDSTVTPSVSTVPDGPVNDDNAATSDAGVPDFDTSNISLPADDNANTKEDNATSPAPVPPEDLLTSGGNDDLINIKQDALKQLSPLVGHLDQSPEEKFRTTMMMIQASDDQSLVKTAYEAAKEISDDKVRAQALLDIINEINYFTQQHKS